MTDAIILFLSALLLEVGWVLSVRLVVRSRAVALCVSAMVMQLISYQSTLIVVDRPMLRLVGILGAGLGALVALRLTPGSTEDD